MNEIWLTCSTIFAILIGSSAMSETVYVDVTVNYRERVALPPEAELEVEIQDVSRADAVATVMDYKRVPITAVPMTLRLGVDDTLIDERYSYSVRGEIYSGDRVLFRSTTATPVLTRGAPDKVDLRLVQAEGTSERSVSTNPLAGVEWEVFELGGRMLVLEDLPTIVFEPNGRFGLYGGCNRLTGQADIGEDNIEFPKQMAGTRKACPDVQMKLEDDVLEALGASSGYVRNGDLLSLTNSNGVTKVRFRARR